MPADRVAPWAFMWALSFAIFAGFKGWTYSKARGAGLGYLLWPGMDPEPFVGRRLELSVPLQDWLFAAAKTGLGAFLLWGAARLFRASELAAGWTGLFGIVFLLHFGTFHLLALGWRKAGVPVEPLMRRPLLATSLGDFWGKRWNVAFRELGHRLVFVPLHRPLGAKGATWLVFLASGLIHDLVISVPAGAGYGLPTGYFLLQGAGAWLERSALGRRLGLGRGVAGWLFTAVVAGGPAFWLFHPPFVRRVIIPFMEVIGAL
jgi:hypothetical protein